MQHKLKKFYANVKDGRKNNYNQVEIVSKNYLIHLNLYIIYCNCSIRIYNLWYWSKKMDSTGSKRNKRKFYV